MLQNFFEGLRILRRTARKFGFSLPEIVAGLTIFGILAAVILATVIKTTTLANTQDRVNQAAVTLDDLARAIAFFEPTKPATSFKQTVGVYPGKLSHLVNPITVSQLNSCNAVYTSTQVAAWKGNYYDKNIPLSGYKVADGFVAQDSLIRLPADTTFFPAGALSIVIPSVDPSDAAALARTVDNDSTGTIGSVRFVTNGSLPITVAYIIMVGGC